MSTTITSPTAAVATTTSFVDISRFIRVPPQLIVQFGTKGKRAWFLDLEEHVGDAGLLFITLKGCDMCSFVAKVLSHMQKVSNKKIMVYVLEVSEGSSRCLPLLRNMDVTRSPSLFVVKTSTGRLIRILDGQRDPDIIRQLTPESLEHLVFESR